MKTLKTLTVAVIAAVSLVFCVTSAKAYSVIGYTTNYDTVNFSVTLTTNKFTATTNEAIANWKYISVSQKFVTKDLLNLLTNLDFAGTSFPTGSKLVVGWDPQWNGDLLVVDKSGSDVLYDATTHSPNDGNYVAVNFYNQQGSPNFNETANITNMTGSISLAWYNNGSFKLIDQTNGISITGTGPSTEHFNFKAVSAISSTWSDSQSFVTYGADEISGPSAFPGTLTGSITASGRGKGMPEYLVGQVISLAP